MLLIYLLSSCVFLLASRTLSISVNFHADPVTIQPLHPVTLTCDISDYHPGSANYSVAFYRGHSTTNRHLIGTHDVFTINNNHHSVLFSAGKFLDAEAHSGMYYFLPRFEVNFQPKANLTAYELYWCELVEQSHVPVLTHPSNVLSVEPSVNFELSARGVTPITATCTLDNFKATNEREYSVVFYNAGQHVYRLGTYRVRLGAEEEFIPDSTQPEVTVHGRRFTFPVFEVTIDRRFTDLVYYCALELADTSSAGVKQYKSNTVHG